jgi:hypothetical protein
MIGHPAFLLNLPPMNLSHNPERRRPQAQEEPEPKRKV